MRAAPSARYRLAVVNSHPIQYFAPLYRRLAREPNIQLKVYFCSRAGAEPYRDKGFGGRRITWDVPLLEGYDHEFLPNLRDGAAPGGFWSLVNPAVLNRFRRERYDAVWIHGHAYASNVLALVGAKVAGSAVFMRCETHLRLDRPWLRRAVRGPVMRAFYHFFDACLAIGTGNAEFYRQHGVGPNRLFHVPYVVDNARFIEGARRARARSGQVRRSLGLPPRDVPVVLWASKLTRRKRPGDLLKAFARFRQCGGSRAALVFVGDGEERKPVERLARRQGLDDVYFLGFRNQSELPAIYAMSDVFVLPSANEPWGLVVNEAMCAGLPVVASDDVGAAADLIRPGVNGFLFSAGDVGGLADRLIRLLEDETLRSRMGEASLEIISSWDLEACVEGVSAALRSTCGEPTPIAATKDGPPGRIGMRA